MTQTSFAGVRLAATEKRINLILASFDAVAVDTIGSELLGHDPRSLEYLRLANGRLGSMDKIEILNA